MGRKFLLPIVLGDMAVFVLFAVLGLTHHRQPLTLERVVHAACPFAFVWFAVAPFLGAFRSPTLTEPRRALWHIPLCWLVCGLLGFALRSWLGKRPFVFPFAVVTLVSVAVLLTLWRVAAAFGTAHLKPHTADRWS